MLLTGMLYHRLADINEEAAERLDLIIRQMQKAEGITEDLKRKDMIAWVGAMNNIKARATAADVASGFVSNAGYSLV